MFPNVRLALVTWGEQSFFRNISIYARDPKKFAQQTSTEIFKFLTNSSFESKI
jgi:hypothetical protein